MAKFNRFTLPYSFESLEPYIDAQTMELHSEKHHQTYTDKLNAAVEGSEFEENTIEELLSNLDSLPDDKKTAVKNNGGGFYNHNHFFSVLSKEGSKTPQGKVLAGIEESYGDFESYKKEFSELAVGLFGSGWAWLASDADGTNFHIHAHPNQENPIMHKHIPVLGFDVWEHGYYLKYQNKRADYIDALWNVIDWDKVESLFGENLNKFNN